MTSMIGSMTMKGSMTSILGNMISMLGGMTPIFRSMAYMVERMTNKGCMTTMLSNSGQPSRMREQKNAQLHIRILAQQ